MPMRNFQITQLTQDELLTLINKGLKEQLDNFKMELQNKNNQEELLSRDATCKLLDIDSSTLWRYTTQGRINSYGIAGRRYYKRSEILESLIINKNK
jgi:hypothetical protein